MPHSSVCWGALLRLICAGFGISLALNVAAHPHFSVTARGDRTEADIRRDALDHSPELLRMAGIRQGMSVADILAGDGYYTELLSHVVGPSGHVLMMNNKAFDGFSKERLDERHVERLSNVSYQVVDLNHLRLLPESLNAIVLCKAYHDLYWVDTTGIWPKIDPDLVLNQLIAALRPGGVLLLIDHSAIPGHGRTDASTLHRMDEDFAREDFARRGLKVIASSNLLRRADDPRELVSYLPPMLGKTDRFVLIFSKTRRL
jgi:predicted methyltransferase